MSQKTKPNSPNLDKILELDTTPEEAKIFAKTLEMLKETTLDPYSRIFQRINLRD